MNDGFWYLAPPNSPPQAEWDHDKMELELEPVPLGGGSKRLTNLNVVLSGGSVKDFVRTWQSEWMIPDSTLELLQRHQLSGFITKPVTARYARSNQAPPRLWELVVVGWGGIARPESGIRYDEANSSPAYGFFHYTGLVDAEKLMDVGQWDGSDFFMVWPLPRFIFITERVARVIREHRLQGVRVKPVSKLKDEMSGSGPGFSPGRLSDFMPDERARELGESLGIY